MNFSWFFVFCGGILIGIDYALLEAMMEQTCNGTLWWFGINKTGCVTGSTSVTSFSLLTARLSTTPVPTNIEVTTNLQIQSNKETSSGLEFLDVPEGDDMRIQELKLEEKYPLFELFSTLVSYLQPSEFPSDLLRQILQFETPIPELAYQVLFSLNWQSLLHWLQEIRPAKCILRFQIIKLDKVSFSFILFWGMVSLCLPFSVLIYFCFAMDTGRFNDRLLNNDRKNTIKKSCGYLLHIFLVLLLCPMIFIMAANEQISRSLTKSPEIVGIIYEDLYTFIRNSHMQISFVATSSTDIAIEAIRKDLDEIDRLVGVTYQQEMASETGMDVELPNLERLQIETASAASIALDLLRDCEAAGKAAEVLKTQLKDIAFRLMVLKQQCSMRDSALCQTLQFTGYEVSLPLDNITYDDKVLQLQRLYNEGDFNQSIEYTRRSFSSIPEDVAFHAAQFVADMKSLLSKKRTQIFHSTHDLDVLVRSISQEIKSYEEAAFLLAQKALDWDTWRWIVGLGVAVTLSIIWGLFLCGAPCGCGFVSKTVTVLKCGLTLASTSCLLMWLLGSLSLLIGSNSQLLVCLPFYDHPRYNSLSQLYDAGGVFYPESGLFGRFIKGSDDLQVANVLKACQREHAAYATFGIEDRINLEKNLNFKGWNDMETLLYNFTSSESHYEILSPALQVNLHILSSITSTNFSAHRLEFSTGVTKKDVGSFADQINTVARQLSDPVVARKFDNLAFDLRKIVDDELRTVSQIRGRILYKLTNLEVILSPLNRHVKQSLSHLKSIQFFIDSRGWQTAQKVRGQFVKRIENHLEKLYTYVSTKINKDVGKCRPLWDIFHASRFFLCKLIVDPMNGIAVCSVFVIFIFVGIAPIVIKLIKLYRKERDESISTPISRDSSDGLLIEDEAIWTTPPQQSPLQPVHALEWSIPALPSMHIQEPIIPSPPRPPSTVSRRISAVRIPQIPFVSRMKSPKLADMATTVAGIRRNLPKVSRTRAPRRGGHESLKLIEPIHWKSGSTTPGSWI
ncbi:prominin-1 [Cylas formicarius]|uniref:prominin-1 n=1 Tax=Cylas formicarius TaxID=197179 RepID=UPI0029589BDC|nr:prominin-1 [Cylas formicarius]